MEYLQLSSSIFVYIDNKSMVFMVFYRFQSVVQLDMSILLTKQPLGIMMLNKDLYIFVTQPDRKGEPMDADVLSEKAKKLKHVKVYNRLYSMIQDGVYPPGSQLPSEPELALQMDVSRMTLRRALALLQEDNLVINIRGKGNFISERNPGASMPGLEVTQHPVRCTLSGAIDETEMEFRIEPPTESISQNLKRKTAVVVIADRWYKNAGKACAYSLSFIPIEVISGKQIDLREKEDLFQYLEHGVYEDAVSSTCQLSYTTTGNFTAVKYMLSQHASFILVQETLYDENSRVLVSSKHYIPVESFKTQVNAVAGRA